MFQRRSVLHPGPTAGRGRGARLVAAAALPVMLAGIGLQTAPAFAATGSAASNSPPTCSLGNITVGTSTTSGGMQLIAQDQTSGLGKLVSPYHVNAAPPTLNFTPGQTAPFTADFTQISGTDGSSGSLKIFNTTRQKTICLGQFKTMLGGGRADSVGFSFPQDRNWLVIQNGSPGLSSVQVTLNGVVIDQDLTLGNVPFTQDLSAFGLDICNPMPGSCQLNQLDITPTGPDGSSAEAVVWGVGPFIYNYPE
jgi:hypothetical protein